MHCNVYFLVFRFPAWAGTDAWDGKGAWWRQSDLFRTLSETVAVAGPEVLDLSPRQKSFHYTIKTDQLLPGYSAKCPRYNQSRNSFILPVSTFIDVLANTVKEDLLDFQVTRAAPAMCWSLQRLGNFTGLHNIICQVLHEKELSYKGPCLGGWTTLCHAS